MKLSKKIPQIQNDYTEFHKLPNSSEAYAYFENGILYELTTNSTNLITYAKSKGLK